MLQVRPQHHASAHQQAPGRPALADQPLVRGLAIADQLLRYIVEVTERVQFVLHLPVVLPVLP